MIQSLLASLTKPSSFLRCLPLPFRRHGAATSPTQITQFSTTTHATPQKTQVAIFWDLDNKPPPNVPPYDAAVRLRLAASRFGAVRFTVAYANPHSFRYVPPMVLDQRCRRAALDRLEDSGAAASDEPYTCGVCGRRFPIRSKLLGHFKALHEREHAKRLRQLEAAKGSRRVKLAAKVAVKIEKYRRAAREAAVVPKVGYGLADELRRAGVWVRSVPDVPEAADRALRRHMVDSMDKELVGCVVLVSDDLGFTGVLREARMRCLKTVVVGNDKNGALKRYADAGFSWKEVASGKMMSEATSVVGRWNDGKLLRRLEWTYDEGDERPHGLFDGESGEEEEQDVSDALSKSKSDPRPWWELDSD